mgnify:CR=1 FL=1
MMKLTIFKNNQKIGVINFSENEGVSCEQCDVPLANLITELKKDGARVMRDLQTDNERTVIEGLIKNGEPGFIFGVIDALERNGYEVKRESPEIDAELIEALKRLPDENLENEIKNAVSDLSLLEKTTLLETLQGNI